MAVPIEKATIGMEGNEPSRKTASSISVPNDTDESDRTSLEKSTHDMAEDQYPHGLKLVLLAGASIVAVFLIALDQVRTNPPTLT